MNHYILKKENYITSDWSGGSTQQIFIYPENSTLSERNFEFRISSAIVNVDESVFSDFIGYDRIISSLEGEIELTHYEKEKIKSIKLKPFMQDIFSGSIKTKCIGRCRDFNIIYKEDLESELRTLTNGSSYLKAGYIYIIFAVKDLEIEANLEDGVRKIFLRDGDAYYFENCLGNFSIISNDNIISSFLCCLKI